jgi:hypothetical protein
VAFRRPVKRWLVRLDDPPSQCAYYAFVAAHNGREAGRLLRDAVSLVERAGFEDLLSVEEVAGPPAPYDLTRGVIAVDEVIGCRLSNRAPGLVEAFSWGRLPDASDVASIMAWRHERGFEP